MKRDILNKLLVLSKDRNKFFHSLSNMFSSQDNNKRFTLSELKQQKEIITNAYLNRQCNRTDYNRQMDEIEREEMVSTNNVLCSKGIHNCLF